ncbi:LytTR family DNA-binding domain-containing protein [Winogradskyella sp.]|nr:LytTR family DNA-binding domain-containing protein [Winogradskyella sp.]MDB9755468.1 LytTR family DNA-binding domain-containing protein [Winogradskyella sp.]
MVKQISCIIVDDELIAREIIASHLSKIENITVKAQCKNAIEAFNFITTTQVDLVFLDINMPEISGIAFAKSINKNIKIIFTTAYRDYAVEGFNLHAVDYLLKPIAFSRLLKSVNRYFEISSPTVEIKQEHSEKHNFIFIRSDRKMIKVDFDTIIYVESYSDYIKIHLKNKVLVTRETITAIEAKLPKSQFLRIHRSYIVCIAKIEAFTSEYITINGVALSVSRSYKKDVLKQLEKF